MQTVPRKAAEPRQSALDPSHIMQTATAFWASKVLLTAVEFDVFTVLGEQAMTGPQLGEKLRVHPRGIYDFFDALVTSTSSNSSSDIPVMSIESSISTCSC